MKRLRSLSVAETVRGLRGLRQDHIEDAHCDSGHSISARMESDGRCDDLRIIDNAIRLLRRRGARSNG